MNWTLGLVIFTDSIIVFKARHWTVCEAAGIPPLDVVVKFVDAVPVMQLLPPERCPKIKTPKPSPAPTPTPTSTSLPPSTKPRPKPRQKKVSVLPQDIVMVELNGLDDEDLDTTPKNKGKGRADDVGTAVKRALQESPSHEEGSSKRSRIAKPRVVAGGVECEGLEFGEDTVISPGVLPEVKGMVSPLVGHLRERSLSSSTDLQTVFQAGPQRLQALLVPQLQYYTGNSVPELSRKEAGMFIRRITLLARFLRPP